MTTMNRFATDVKLIRKSRKEKKMNVLEIKGNVNTALCYAKVVEDEAIEQIKRMCDYAMSEGSKIRIMPDVHAGKGCTIGTTMTIIDKAVPNVVGVDIGCGMYTVNLGKDEIDFETLFDQNVIIDLSRVGSSETKSLLMGILVLKLQEYRMCTADETNSELTHITVLEEAHHLLKRTSTEQTSEGANLLGKSVEMIANAIAEMRTYGEGFIIVDQSPGLLDMAAIRNTNTKIIMRLPDQGDRELVGKAAGLNDDQIMELAKLPLGCSAVYQNEGSKQFYAK